MPPPSAPSTDRSAVTDTENKPTILPQLSIAIRDDEPEPEASPSVSSAPVDTVVQISDADKEATLKLQQERERADIQRAKRAKLLGEDNLYKTMWQLTYPDLIGKLVGACYTLADAVFISNMAGDTVAERSISLASISFTMPLEQAFIAGVALMGTVGFSSSYSRYLGENNLVLARASLGNVYLTCICLGILIPLILIPLLKPILRLIGASDEAGTLAPASQYFTILLLFDIVSNFQFAGNNMTRAEGASVYSATMMIIGAVINVILDPIFIKYVGLGLSGAATATIFGQTVVSAIGLYYFLGGRSVVTFNKACWKPNWTIMKFAFNVGIASFISSISGAIVSVISNRLILAFSPYGPTAVETTEIVSVSGALAKFSFFVFLPMLSMSHGVLPILSFCKGAKLYGRFVDAIKACIIVSLVLGIVLCILGYVLSPYVALMFSTSPTFVQTFTTAMRYMTSSIPFMAIFTAIMPALQATGHGTAAAITMLCRQCLGLLAAEVAICYWDNSFWGCFMGYPVADAVTLLVSIFFYFYYFKEFNGDTDKDYQAIKNMDIEMKSMGDNTNQSPLKEEEEANGETPASEFKPKVIQVGEPEPVPAAQN